MPVVPVGEQFRAAKLKIKRANKHIADIEAVINALPDTYAARLKNDPKTGDKLVEYGLKGSQEITSDLALMIGDAIHNLKSALDYAWIGVLEKHIPPVRGNDKFP